MQPHSIKFVYNAVNALASGKFDRDTEATVTQAIEAELLAIADPLPSKAPLGITI